MKAIFHFLGFESRSRDLIITINYMGTRDFSRYEISNPALRQECTRSCCESCRTHFCKHFPPKFIRNIFKIAYYSNRLLNRTRDIVKDIKENSEYDPGFIENGGIFIARNQVNVMSIEPSYFICVERRTQM